MNNGELFTWKENITLALYFPVSLEYMLFSFHIGVESKIFYRKSFSLCLKSLQNGNQ